jgi:hypothetical protein
MNGTKGRTLEFNRNRRDMIQMNFPVDYFHAYAYFYVPKLSEETSTMKNVVQRQGHQQIWMKEINLVEI